jgi:8-oxo-dGTP pyrophosphatase MutT (NUDIX family)
MTDLLDVRGVNPWQTRSSRVVFENSRYRLREDDVIQPDGQPGSYVYLELPHPIVAIVPVDDQNRVHLVRQWRYVWGRNSWEIPAGGAEPDEDPLVSAQRELAEEVGLDANEWEPLGSGYASATISADYHLYLARGLQPSLGGHNHRDGAEHDMITQAVPIRQAIEAAMDGRIVHAFTIIGILRAARRLGV